MAIPREEAWYVTCKTYIHESSLVPVRRTGLEYTGQKYSNGRSYWDTPITNVVSYHIGYVETRVGKLSFCFLETDNCLQNN